VVYDHVCIHALHLGDYSFYSVVGISGHSLVSNTFFYPDSEELFIVLFKTLKPFWVYLLNLHLTQLLGLSQPVLVVSAAAEVDLAPLDAILINFFSDKLFLCHLILAQWAIARLFVHF